MSVLRQSIASWVIPGALLLSACGSNTPAPAPQPQPQPGTSQPQLVEPAPTSPTPDSKPTFQAFVVLREFGGFDNSAVFGILPSRPGMKLTGITGPLFLGKPQIETLTKDSVKTLFTHSAHAWSEAEQEALVAKFAGAQLIFFENYSGHLCTDQEMTLNVTEAMGDRKPELTFHVTAVQQDAEDCRLHAFALETTD